jgi:translation initiation factor 4E
MLQKLRVESVLHSKLCAGSMEEEITPVPSESHSVDVDFLADEWVFWYLIPNRTGVANSADGDWSSYLHPLHAFQTVEAFTRILHSVEQPAKLLKGCRYYVFRRHCKPVWEDKEAAGGQMVSIEVSKQPDRGEQMNTLWKSVVLAMMGGHFPDGDSIIGAEYNSKPLSFRIALWVSAQCVDLDSMKEAMRRVTEAVAEVQTQIISAE